MVNFISNAQLTEKVVSHVLCDIVLGACCLLSQQFFLCATLTALFELHLMNTPHSFFIQVNQFLYTKNVPKYVTSLHVEFSIARTKKRTLHSLSYPLLSQWHRSRGAKGMDGFIASSAVGSIVLRPNGCSPPQPFPPTAPQAGVLPPRGVRVRRRRPADRPGDRRRRCTHGGGPRPFPPCLPPLVTPDWLAFRGFPWTRAPCSPRFDNIFLRQKNCKPFFPVSNSSE